MKTRMCGKCGKDYKLESFHTPDMKPICGKCFRDEAIESGKFIASIDPLGEQPTLLSKEDV